MSSSDLCPYVEKGLKSGPPLLFLAGFPDNETSGWGKVVPTDLGKKYRCIFMCLPGYSARQDPRTNKPWGYEQEDVLRMMGNTLDALGLRTKPFPMIAHDWGAFYALLYTTRHPAEVSNLILCDVGMVDPFSLPLFTIPYIIFYQVYFAIVYIISQTLSVRLATFIFWALKRYFQFMMPTPHDRFHLPENEITVHKCYPYYYLWRRLLTGSMLKIKFPSCPLLYLVRIFFFEALALLANELLTCLFFRSRGTGIVVRHQKALHVPRPAVSRPHRRHTRVRPLLPPRRALVHGGRAGGHAEAHDAVP